MPAVRIASVCLSSSYFLEMSWKEDVLGVAERMLNGDGKKHIITRIKLRRMALARLSSNTSPKDQIFGILELSSALKPVDELSNVYFGETLLFKARLFVDMEQHQDALSTLDLFRPYKGFQVSTLEQIVSNDIAFLRGEIARYDADFKGARICFLELMKQSPAPPKIAHHLSAVSCELGSFDFAIDSIADELQPLVPDSRKAKRLRLALAEAYLMAGVQLASQESDVTAQRISLHAVEFIRKAGSHLERLQIPFDSTQQLGKIGKIDRFRVLLASAIVEHVTGDPVRAIKRWSEAQISSQQSWPEGFTDMIILYSQADLAFRCRDMGEGARLETAALQIYKRTGRRYHFTGLGTMWPSYVGLSMELRHGREALK